MQLVEGRTGDNPMMLLVQRVENRCIGKDAIEELGALGARLGRQGDRQQPKSPEPLHLPCLLAEARLRGESRDGHGASSRGPGA